MNASTRTISTLLTPPGAGAIAVIRIEGAEAERYAGSMFQAKSGTSLAESRIGRLRYGVLTDGDEVLDDVVACVVAREPEPVVELCTHGGVRVVERVLSVLERRGAVIVGPWADSLASATRPACGATSPPWPVANAIERDADEWLGYAKTGRAVRFLAAQRRLLPACLAELAARASLDPPRVHADLHAIRGGYHAARRLIGGATVVLVGPPNAGKSALFNRLIGRDAAVVSAIEGTTRDWVSGTLEIDGVPLTLQDTAGDHSRPDAFERAAIRAGRSLCSTADLVLLLGDASRWPEAAYAAAVVRMGKDTASGDRPPPPVLLVLNKQDLVGPGDLDSHGAEYADPSAPAIFVSARTGSGVAGLMSAMGRLLGVDRPVAERPCLFAPRQWDTASDALSLPITETDGLGRALNRLLTGSRGNG